MKDYLTIGVTKNGEEARINLRKEPPRIGILGSSGSGKSVMLCNIVLMLAKIMRERVQFICIDPKMQSLIPIQSRLAKPIVSNPAKFLTELKDFEELMNQRYVVMKERGMTKIDPIDDLDEFPLVVLILEELPAIVNNTEIDKASLESIKNTISLLLTRIRAANMGMIICSQSFSEKEGISTMARGQLSTRIAMRCEINANKTFTEGMFDLAPAYQLHSPGTFFLAKDSNFNIWEKCKTWFKPDDEYQQLAESYSIDKRDPGFGWHVDDFLEEKDGFADEWL